MVETGYLCAISTLTPCAPAIAIAIAIGTRPFVRSSIRPGENLRSPSREFTDRCPNVSQCGRAALALSIKGCASTNPPSGGGQRSDK